MVDLKVDELRQFMNAGGLSGSVAQQATQRVEGLSSIAQLTRGLEGLQIVEKMYALDTSATQFFYVDNRPQLNYVELTVTRAANLPLYRSLKVSELKLIASLDKDAKQYTVAAGDRLWDIVKAEYGSEALWPPLRRGTSFKTPIG
ncbi:hypothetical protein LZK73_11915 [Neorhizobium galegae]|nr:hypothetical protein LZK73_11915 [Neorhizobium galegae]